MTDVEIRPVTTEDSSALAPLLDELGYPTSASEVAARIPRLSVFGAAIALVAVERGEIVGLATGHRVATLHAPTDAAQLTTLVVSEAARRRGIGTRLVQSIERWAVEQGCTRVTLTTAVHRAEAHIFYENAGYEHTGRRYAKRL